MSILKMSLRKLADSGSAPNVLLLGLLSGAIAGAVFLGGCRTSETKDEVWSQAAGDVGDVQLARLCQDYWELRLNHNPRWATYLGDPRYHGELRDNSPLATERRAEELALLERRLRGIDPSLLSKEDRITHELLGSTLDLALSRERSSFEFETWNIDPLRGPQNEFLNLAAYQPVHTEGEREQLLERWSRMARHIDQSNKNLRRGLRAGRVGSEAALHRVIEQLDRLLATAPQESPLTEPALGGGSWLAFGPGANLASIAQTALGDRRRSSELELLNPELDTAVLAGGGFVLLPGSDDSMPRAARGRYVQAVLERVRDEIYPAFERQRELLVETILPSARPDDQAGIGNLAGGEQYYLDCIRYHTSLELVPEEIHRFGLEEVARVRSEMSDLGERALGTADLAEIQRRLREDPAMHFETEQEVQAKAEAALAKASTVMDAAFGLQPEAACEVVPVPAHEAPYTTIAYYREPAADGSRPGRYYINTFAPKTRTRYEAEVLAYHEAIPGHHLQIAIAQELDGLPLFRRHEGHTAFVEGWALYTERLCDELELYTSDIDRLGMLSYDAWRASRLVVDTGIHALGWSRRQAVEYMTENTLLAVNNIENEVDRYIAWPGQALAYKIGQREILALRARARAALGDRYDDREFHDRVLRNGAVTLGVLRREIETWISPRSEEP